jgi:hypothetical protein
MDRSQKYIISITIEIKTNIEQTHIMHIKVVTKNNMICITVVREHQVP